MVLVMLPFFMFAMYEKNGQPLEKIIRNIVQVSFIRPKERPYKTNNFYSAVVRQEKLDKEVQQIVQGEKAHKSGKSSRLTLPFRTPDDRTKDTNPHRIPSPFSVCSRTASVA